MAAQASDTRRHSKATRPALAVLTSYPSAARTLDATQFCAGDPRVLDGSHGVSRWSDPHSPRSHCPTAIGGSVARERGRPRAGGLLAVAAAALAVGACGRQQQDPCTQADLDRPVLSGMPTPVAIVASRELNGERLDPLPAGATVSLTAEQAWSRLRSARADTGGGGDELLLGMFTGDRFERVPAWVLFSSHRAQGLEPLDRRPGVTGADDAMPCAFVDVLTVLNADTGSVFLGSTMTSAGPRRDPPVTDTAPTPPRPPDAT